MELAVKKSSWQGSLTMNKNEIKYLGNLVEKLKKAKDDEQRLAVIDGVSGVSAFMEQAPRLASFLSRADAAAAVLLKSVIAIGMGPRVFAGLDVIDDSDAALTKLLAVLQPVETFYREMGGIIGYHHQVIKLIKGDSDEENASVHFHQPQGLDLAVSTEEAHAVVRYAIENLDSIGEIYPVGGAGDRLGLKDPKTGEHLPAAQLMFTGKTLLELLIRDVQAREHLCYQLTGKKVLTPIALMTSQEKDNDLHIRDICESNGWFGRPSDTFFIFKQPLVPVLTEEGEWIVEGPLTLMLKPGGHGVMWKLASDRGVFDWFREHGRRQLFVRQINNPMACTDNGMLAFVGQGLKHGKAFGFASCQRRINTAEGTNVIIERNEGERYAYCISNIEYTEFAKYGINDIPIASESDFSAFPANTNILFADIDAVETAVRRCPIPGMLINMKNQIAIEDAQGNKRLMHYGRLESTMQNIADEIVDVYDHEISPKQYASLQTFLTFNSRRKTISVTKKAYAKGGSILETPVGCYYDLLQNARELLVDYCGFRTPDIPDEMQFPKQRPPFLFVYHPILGPLWSVIRQKIRGGTLAEGAEVVLQISELLMEQVSVDGSMRIACRNLPGGRCRLKNVTVQNKGVDWKHSPEYWSGAVTRTESVSIIIEGDGEFIAENVTFTGDVDVVVPAGTRITAYHDEKGKLAFHSEEVAEPGWHWKYHFAASDEVVLHDG